MEIRSIRRTAFFALLLLVSTLACNTVTNGILPTPTYIDDVVPFPATYPPAPTRDPSLPPRWVLYERALASILLGPVGETQPDVSQDQGLCEWEIWGQKGIEIYVWAECQATDLATGTATSAPAVIRLAEDGSIAEVVMPDEGMGNIRDLFPKDVLARIFNNEFDAVKAMQHIAQRRADPSIPPMIVEQGVELP